MTGSYIKKIEFFIFGALSAYKNNHFQEALCFVSQAPIMVITDEGTSKDD